MRNFGARYRNGILNHPTLANERRTSILSHAYSEANRVVDRVSSALLKLARMIGEPIANAIKDSLPVLGRAYVRVDYLMGSPSPH